MTVTRVFCGVTRARSGSALDVAVVDSGGQLLSCFGLTDDPEGYASLRMTIARRQNDGTIAVTTDDPARTVIRLVAAAGGAVTVVDGRAATDFGAGFGGSDASWHRVIGLAQSLRVGALRSARLTAPPDLEPLHPALVAHAALVMGRINAERTLREVLQALYPAALYAFPNPSAPVTLAILGELNGLDVSAWDTLFAWKQRVAARVTVAGSENQVVAAVNALAEAAQRIPGRAGADATFVFDAVRHAAAAVQSIDAAIAAVLARLKPTTGGAATGRATVPPRATLPSALEPAPSPDDQFGRADGRFGRAAAAAGAGGDMPRIDTARPASYGPWEEFPDPLAGQGMGFPASQQGTAAPTPSADLNQYPAGGYGRDAPASGFPQRVPGAELPAGAGIEPARVGSVGSSRPARATPRPAVEEPPREGGVAAAQRERVLLAHVPSRVARDTEFSVVVRIARDANALPGALISRLTRLVVRDQPVPVTVLVHASAELRAETTLQQVITVPADGDPDPVLFGFRATATGEFDVRVSAYAGGSFLAELTGRVTVAESGSTEQGTPITALIDRVAAEPGEVALQVSAGRGRYSFQLLSDRTWYEPVFVDQLTDQPDDAVARAIATLQQIADGSPRRGYTPPNSHRWMRETGAGLWSSMIPQPIQDQFWALRSNMTSFSVASGHDRVPWEMLYPLSSDQDEGFLVERMPVLRRTYNQQRARVIGTRDPCFVVPPKSPTHALAEVEQVHRILGGPGEPRVVTELAELLDLVDSGDLGLTHFACHNTFDEDGSRIQMADGSFRPELLNTAVTRRRLKRTSPLVFLNACRSAGEIPEYTRMMGWAGQFMGAGAGAFVGTLWPVRSETSALFAESFYAELLSGQTLGQATLSARLAVSKELGDPTWLAYTVYGDPRATAAK